MKVKAFYIRLADEYLQTDQDHLNDFLSSVTVKKTATELLTSQSDCWSVPIFYEESEAEKQLAKLEKISVITEADLTWEEKKVFAILKQWRQDRANELDIPIYLVCNNVELMTVAKLNPRTLEDLSKIRGFRDNVQKMAKFGEDIVAVLNSL